LQHKPDGPLDKPVLSFGNLAEYGGAYVMIGAEDGVVPVLEERRCRAAILPYICSVVEGVGKVVISVRGKV